MELIKKAKEFIEKYELSRDRFLRVIANLREFETCSIVIDGVVNKATVEDWMYEISNIRKTYELAVGLRDLEECAEECAEKHKARKKKVLYLDLETTDLSAGFSPILMCGYKWNDEETKLLSLADEKYRDDLINLPPERVDVNLLRDISELINEADVMVAHFGAKFDFPFIQTRCLYHRLPIVDLKKDKILDPWRISKFNLRCGRRLKALASQLDCKNQKDEVELIYWQRSKCIGDNPYFLEALEVLGEYCIQDVNTLHEITQLLMPLATHIPSAQTMYNDIMLCPHCESENIKSNGYRYTKANKYIRYRCSDCGAWFRGSKSVSTIDVEKRLMY